MSITRRLFLRNTAAASAVTITIASPALADAPLPAPPFADLTRTASANRETLPSGGSPISSKTVSAYQQAIWHIRELERLISEDGGYRPTIIIQAEYGPHDYRMIGVDIFGRFIDGDGMFQGGVS